MSIYTNKWFLNNIQRNITSCHGVLRLHKELTLPSFDIYKLPLDLVCVGERRACIEWLRANY